MAVANRADLIARFATGKTPPGTDFEDLIDTIFDQNATPRSLDLTSLPGYAVELSVTATDGVNGKGGTPVTSSGAGGAILKIDANKWTSVSVGFSTDYIATTSNGDDTGTAILSTDSGSFTWDTFSDLATGPTMNIPGVTESSGSPSQALPNWSI